MGSFLELLLAELCAQGLKLPAGKKIIPGVIDSTTNVVEHPELVADRILNHVASSTLGTVQRVYQRSQMLNERRTALVLWGDKVMQEVLSLSC